METIMATIRLAFRRVQQLETGTLAEWFAAAGEQPRIFLLDVRAPEEFAVSRIGDASNVSPATEPHGLRDGLLKEYTPGADRIVLYCSVGYRSSQLAKALMAEEWVEATDVFNLQGSIFKWANEGREVNRDAHPVADVHPYNAVWGKALNADLRAYEPRAVPAVAEAAGQ